MAIVKVTPRYSAMTPSENRMRQDRKQTAMNIEVQPSTGISCRILPYRAFALNPRAASIESVPRIEMSLRGRVPAVRMSLQKWEARLRSEYPEGRPRSFLMATGQRSMLETTHDSA